MSTVDMNEFLGSDVLNYDWDTKATEEMTKSPTSFVDETFWNPDKKNPNTYVIRFIPDARTKMNWISINTHNITHFPNGERKFFFGNCISTKTKQSSSCPICKYGWGLWRTKIKANQEKAKDGGWTPKQEWISNILVIRDPVNPENNGKVFKFRYGSTIFKLIEKRLKPDDAAKSDIDFKEFNPFNPMTGANLKLVVNMTESTRGGKPVSYPDYKQSRFYDQQTPISESKDQIIETLSKSYNLEEYINSLNYLTNDVINNEVGYIINTAKFDDVVTDNNPQVVNNNTTSVVNKVANNEVDKLDEDEMMFIKGV